MNNINNKLKQNSSNPVRDLSLNGANGLNKKIIILILILFSVFMLLKVNYLIKAETEPDNSVIGTLKETAEPSGYNVSQTNEETFKNTIIDIISYILGFLGLLFVIMIIYSGFQWMMSGGNEEVINKAKSRIKASIIGVIIILSSWVIAYAVISIIQESTV